MTDSLQSRERLPPWLQWLALAFAAVVAFGAVVPGFYMVADDLQQTWEMHELRHGGRGLFQTIYGVVFRAEGGGHFCPFQDLLHVTFYEVFGIDHWIFAVTVLYAFCHVASGRLIVAILCRLGSPVPLALAAAFLFVLHPVWDENIASVTFGHNVPGLTIMLGACLLWLPVEGASRRRNALRIWGSAALLYVAVGFGINMLVSGAVLLGGMAIAIAVTRRSMRELIVRGVALSATTGLTLLHRWLAYGALGTLHGHYQYLEPSFDAVSFLREIIDGAVLLSPSQTAKWAEQWNPPGLSWDHDVPLVSADTAIVASAAIGLVALVVMATRGTWKSPGQPRSGRLAPGFWFGLAFTIAMVSPYFVFIGGIGTHRYLYQAVAGIAMTATLAAAGVVRLAARVVPRRVITAAGALALFLVLGLLFRVDREAARSIAAGHRVTRAIVDAVAMDVASHPGIKHVFVVGYPRVIGRSGYSITFPTHLIGLLNAKAGTHMVPSNTDYFEAILAGWIPSPLPEDIALYAVEPDGTTVRRVPTGGEQHLPEHVMKEGYLAARRAWKLDDDGEVVARLASPDPATVRIVLRVLFDLERGKRSQLVTRTLEQPTVTLALMQGVLEVARRDAANGRVLASHVAVRASESQEVESAALDVISRDNAAFDSKKAKLAIETERAARAAARDVTTEAATSSAFQNARVAWAAVGVSRDDLYGPTETR